MNFLFAKTYVKFYLVQINSSISYYDHLQKGQEINYDSLFDEDLENCVEGNEEPKQEVSEKFKRYFYFKDKTFSKVEVMGLIIETKVVGNEHNSRFILYLDDTTSLIQCISWENKNSTVYESLCSKAKSGDLVRIYGTVDYYHGFEILIENYSKT